MKQKRATAWYAAIILGGIYLVVRTAPKSSTTAQPSSVLEFTSALLNIVG